PFRRFYQCFLSRLGGGPTSPPPPSPGEEVSVPTAAKAEDIARRYGRQKTTPALARPRSRALHPRRGARLRLHHEAGRPAPRPTGGRRSKRRAGSRRAARPTT